VPRTAQPPLLPAATSEPVPVDRLTTNRFVTARRDAAHRHGLDVGAAFIRELRHDGSLPDPPDAQEAYTQYIFLLAVGQAIVNHGRVVAGLDLPKGKR